MQMMPMVVVKSTTTKAPSAKAPSAKAPTVVKAPSKAPTVKTVLERPSAQARAKGRGYEARAEVWMSPPSSAPPEKPASIKAPSKAPTAPAKEASIKAASVHQWIPPPPPPQSEAKSMALVPMPAALVPPPPPMSVKSSSSKGSGASKNVALVTARAVVKTGASAAAASVKAGTKAESVAKAVTEAAADEGEKNEETQDDVMVSIEETFTRKVSFPVRKGEKMRYGVNGGGKGMFLES